MDPGEGARDEMVDPMDTYQRLQAANPVDESRLPDADSPRARALFEEITMPVPRSSAGNTTTPRRSLMVAVVAVVAVIAAIGGATLGGWLTSPRPVPVADGGADGSQDPVSPGGMAMCVEQYSLESLAARDFAFDGTVAAIDGDEISFDVHEVFTGDVVGTVTLGGATVIAADDSVSSVPGAGLGVGDRALVAGDERFAWGCGFTQAHDPAVADQWRGVLN